LYHLDTERGTDAKNAMDVIEHRRGVLVHDGWASYRTYENLIYGLRNAHHLRELAEIRTNSDAIIAAGHVANPPVAPSGRR